MWKLLDDIFMVVSYAYFVILYVDFQFTDSIVLNIYYIDNVSNKYIH